MLFPWIACDISKRSQVVWNRTDPLIRSEAVCIVLIERFTTSRTRPNRICHDSRHSRSPTTSELWNSTELFQSPKFPVLPNLYYSVSSQKNWKWSEEGVPVFHLRRQHIVYLFIISRSLYFSLLISIYLSILNKHIDIENRDNDSRISHNIEWRYEDTVWLTMRHQERC